MDSSEDEIKIQSARYSDNNIHFSNNQKKFINTMIQFNSESLKDFYGKNEPNYTLFLQIHQITPEKEEIINQILKTEYDLNPFIGDGFLKPLLIKSKKSFNINKKKISYMKPHFSTYSMFTINTRKLTIFKS